MYIKNDFKRKKIHSYHFCTDCEPETAAKPDLGTNSALSSSSDTAIISVTLRTWIWIAYLLAGSLLLQLYVEELTNSSPGPSWYPKVMTYNYLGLSNSACFWRGLLRWHNVTLCAGNFPRFCSEVPMSSYIFVADEETSRYLEKDTRCIKSSFSSTLVCNLQNSVMAFLQSAFLLTVSRFVHFPFRNTPKAMSKPLSTFIKMPR